MAGSAFVGKVEKDHVVVRAQPDVVVEKGVVVEVLDLAVPIGECNAGLFTVAVTQLLFGK